MSESPLRAIFLSYASQDASAARHICEALRACGIDVWLDAGGGLEHGDEWDTKIRDQIKSCGLFMPIISANTQARDEGYFRLEWDLAAERARTIAGGVPFLLPVVIDDTPEPSARVPDRFRTVQWLRLPGGIVPPDVQARLVRLWSRRAGGAGSAPVVSSPSAAGEFVAASRGRRGWMLVITGAMALAALVFFFVWRDRTQAVPTVAPTGTAAGFPHDPDLKRAHQLIYNVVDGISEDFALADDLVKPQLAAHPNAPEVVTVAAELAEEFVARGFDSSTSRQMEARRLTERAVQLAPDSPDALAALGSCLYSTRTQLERAEDSLRRAITLNSREPRYYCSLYQVLTAQRRPSAEIDAFGAQMVTKFPNDPMVSCVIASHYSAINDLTAAETWYDKSLALAPVPYAVMAKAKIMLEVHGDVGGMKRSLERVPERQRTYAGLMTTYAVLATVTGQTVQARRLLDSIGDTWLQDGTYVFPKTLIGGELDQIDGNTDIAKIEFEAALKEVQAKVAADQTDLRFKRTELWIQLGLGRLEEARAALRLNLQRRPRPYRWNIGFVWWTSALRACLILDERKEAMALLTEACAEPTGRLLLRNLFQVDPKMARFHGDPNIIALLAEPSPRNGS